MTDRAKLVLGVGVSPLVGATVTADALVGAGHPHTAVAAFTVGAVLSVWTGMAGAAVALAMRDGVV